jgi:hypothetical protein
MRRHRRSAAVVLALVLIVAVGMFVARSGPNVPARADAAGSNPDLFLFPMSANLFVAQPDLTIVQTAGVVPSDPGLGAFDITYTYDAATIDLSVAPGPMLGSTGRTVSCTQSHPSGSQVRLACASSGAAPGATGSGALVSLALHLNAGIVMPANGATNQLVVIDTAPQTASLLDTQGVALALQRTGDVLVTVRALEGDVTADCVVDIFDEQAILGRNGAMSGSPLYSAAFDIAPAAPDGRIDAGDQAFVTARYGSSCADPHPTQPPSAVNPDDADDDEIVATNDGCPLAYNPDQLNVDANNGASNRPGSDAFGDACDADISGDGYGNVKKSALGKDLATYCAIMRADVDADGSVSILDLSKVATAFGKSVPPAPARDQQTAAPTISILDLSVMASLFSKPVTLCP